MDSCAMDNLDRAKGYLELAKQLRDEHSDRRAIEWRIHVAVWTFLAAVGYATISMPSRIPQPVAFLLLAVFVILHATWTVKMQRSGILEHEKSVRYREMADAIFREEQSISWPQ